MGLFARDAPWIQRIFPPSVTTGIRQPGAVSDDIQLTQDYLAGGQVQAQAPWFVTGAAAQDNPGPGNALTLLAPTSFILTEGVQELWRVFFIDLEIVGSPAGDFNFDLHIINQGFASLPTVCIAEDLFVFNTNADPIPIWPTNRILNSPNQNQIQSNASPLLLAGDFNTSANIVLIQRSAQVAASETLTSRAYVLRNQIGVAHLL